MAWIECRFETTEKKQEEHEELCWGLGAQAVTYLENGLDEIWEPAPNHIPMWSGATVVALFESTVDTQALKTAFKDNFPDISIQLDPLEDKEWTRIWMDSFEPICFGQRLWVCPTWKTPPNEDDCVIRLDPGIAFGTGTHPTTQMCLTVLDGLDVDGKSVCDFGCGSGILGIGAALLGARSVVAIDHCEQAISSSLRNRDDNKISPSVLNAYLPKDAPSDPCDITFANILSGPLIALAPTLAELTSPGGLIILSGLLDTQRADVIAAWQPWAILRSQEQQDQWCCLVLERLGKSL